MEYVEHVNICVADVEEGIEDITHALKEPVFTLSETGDFAASNGRFCSRRNRGRKPLKKRSSESVTIGIGIFSIGI